MQEKIMHLIQRAVIVISILIAGTSVGNAIVEIEKPPEPEVREPIVGGEHNGKGVLTGTDKYGPWRYEGDLVNGKRHGKGVLTGSAKDGITYRYEGDFVEGKLHGRGVISWSSGNRYEGDFVEGKLHGRGVISWNDGNRYEGDWVNGQRTGYGEFRFANGRVVLRGRFENGRFIGP